ncbi:hypothetical protein F4778DRAFT_777127 [Xylariomycetidae sp. FL2044]|nr:hypothetical protein F4778DRAFT_777127 [Xylariomycetidae sp. FL2044]
MWQAAPGYPALPEPVSSGHFKYGSKGLSVNDFRIETVTPMRVLAAERPWIEAQLRLYGIEFDEEADDEKLREILTEFSRIIKAKRVRTDEIEEFEEGLETQWKEKMKVHRKEVVAWKERYFEELGDPQEQAFLDLHRFMKKYFLDEKGNPDPSKTKEPLELAKTPDGFFKALREVNGLAMRTSRDMTVVGWTEDLNRGLDTAFAKIDCPEHPLHIPTSEANLDVRRFLAKYFLIDGKPAPEKTPEPVLLHSFFDKKYELYAEVKYIDDLQVARTLLGESKYGREIWVVGWNNEPNARLKAIKAELAREKIAYEEETRRREAEQWHARLEPHRQYVMQRKLQELEYMVGSYIIKCDKIMRQWDGPMGLHIARPDSPHGTQAAFELGALEGTMLLSLSENGLFRLRQEAEAAKSLNGDIARKRKAESQGARRLEEITRSGRVYLQWVAKRAGVIQVDEGNQHTGYLDFDVDRITASGTIRVPVADSQPVDFSIYKISDQPSREPRHWSEYKVAKRRGRKPKQGS